MKKTSRFLIPFLPAFLVLILIASFTLAPVDSSADTYPAVPSEVPLTAAAGDPQPALFAVTPKAKDNGEKWRVGFLDVEPFPFFGTIVYDTFDKLKAAGWVTYDTLPFDRDNCDALEIFQWAANRDMGPYLAFDPNLCLYMVETGEEKTQQILEERLAQRQDLDLLLVFSTPTGRMATSFDHEVNTLVFGSGNAVKGGIIQSAADSGRDNVMAHMDSTRYQRQMMVFHDVFQFKRIGMVFEDDPVTRSYVAINDYQEMSVEMGFAIAVRHVAKPTSQDSAAWDDYYARLKAEYEKMVTEDQIDAFLLNTAVVLDTERLPQLLTPFYEAKIPVFSQAGGDEVAKGCLMSVVIIDSPSYADYIVDSIAKVLNGVKPRDLKQEFSSTPYTIINLEVCRELGYEPSFELLLSSEEIYNQIE